MLRIDFYNEIARILTYDTANSFNFEPNDEEKAAIHRLLGILGRSYHGEPCTKTVSTYYQDVIARLINPDILVPGDHDDCPCIRSEKHDDFHRCVHGLFSK